MDTRQNSTGAKNVAGVWYPPQGFLAGVGLYRLFCDGSVDDVFRLDNECHACPLNQDAHNELLAHSRRYGLVGPVQAHDARADPAATRTRIEATLNACRYHKDSGRAAEVLCVAFQEHFFNGKTRAPMPPVSGVSEANRGSVGLLIRADKFSFLAMGDLGYNGEILVARSLPNLLPSGYQLVVHKINHQGSKHSTVDHTARASLFSETAFKPCIVLTSHRLQAKPEHPDPAVTSAIMRHLDAEPCVALFSNRAPMGFAPANHTRVVTTGAHDANLGLDPFRSKLVDY
ncbi:hypothetical protein AMAG_19956 [Allomyces macrogynus ATCC 38327]|uniref:Uncharacterized protein n=1 Tax=Allomyces macrogynus (strain ATCC 38327) TaxID=578462 RepID=A0A0L0T2Y3_ALLM3|nr:hypothetical protein AMAG_19956 [Allomyces macrogynus ATCC 38327]|eukprot:KNE69091.1 hypothetical protein AMAG_19956 [Allomyces macrogynus ATCC 38327]